MSVFLLGLRGGIFSSTRIAACFHYNSRVRKTRHLGTITTDSATFLPTVSSWRNNLRGARYVRHLSPMLCDLISHVRASDKGSAISIASEYRLSAGGQQSSERYIFLYRGI
jgi:hypothetical protein